MTLIVALDALGGDRDKLESLARGLCGIAGGLKLGWPNLLEGGPEAAHLVRGACPGGLIIADLKLADIAYTMIRTLESLVGAIDAVIAHAFIGAEGALNELKQWLDRRGIRLVLVASMSHPGARRTFDPCLPRILETVRSVGPWGIVAPATRPWVISVLRRELGGRVRILSPGIGVQGAKPGTALKAGADYEIVGRSITMAEDPVEAARRVLEEQEEALTRAGGRP